tara:strand:- start:323 stop:436 length:114 start_codon:yes stop_codon:yes gene_type:complete
MIVIERSERNGPVIKERGKNTRIIEGILSKNICDLFI